MSRRGCYLALPLLLCVTGCNRQDNEALARIGRKLLDRADGLTLELREHLSFDLGGGDSLETRVTNRLKWDKAVADLPIDIKVNGKEVEVTGIVADPNLKRRAIELIETTTGVEKVIDHVQLLEGPAPIPIPK
jgi:hypothetical protein